MSAPLPGDGRPWVNYIVAQAARASVGLIGGSINAMGCVVRDDEVELHFAVADLTAADREDIDEIAFELDVLLDGHTSIRTVTHEGTALDWSAIEPIFGLRRSGPQGE